MITEPVECGSVTVFAKDNSSGEGGGSLGFRRGHIKTLAALRESSRVTASLNGSVVFSCTVSGGFVRVENDEVTVMTEEMSQVRRD